MHDWSREELHTLQQTALVHTADQARTACELLRIHGPNGRSLQSPLGRNAVSSKDDGHRT